MNGDAISIRTQSLTDEDVSGGRGPSTTSPTQAGIDPVDVNIEDVGPTWGREISRKALIGLVVVLAAITLYITFRFEWKMAIGAMIALVHDVLITAGVYALTGARSRPRPSSRSSRSWGSRSTTPS